MPTHLGPFRRASACATMALFFHPGLGHAHDLRGGAPRGAAIQVLFVDPAGTCHDRTPCFTEIQAGIDSAADGDVVVVGPGSYGENVNFRGKDIVVVAERGPLATVIDGGGTGAVVTFADGEGPSSALVGFTVQNGFSDAGGGIAIDRASPTLLANIIARNRSCSGGGGIGIFFGSPLIAWNRIVGNIQSGCFGAGGGLSVRSASRPAIVANAILANSADDGGGIGLSGARTPVIFNNWIGMNTASSRGGGISMSSVSSADVVQNLIAFNGAARGGGIGASMTLGSRGLIVNNTIVHNTSPEGSGFHIFGFFTTETTLVNNVIVGAARQAAVSCDDVTGEAPVFRSNDVFSRRGPAYAGTCADQSGSNGNISADPRFVSVQRRDFRLRLRSPAIDAGDNAAPRLPPADFGGRARIVNSLIDMGAYESQVPRGGPESAVWGSNSSEVGGLLERARAVYERALQATVAQPVE